MIAKRNDNQTGTPNVFLAQTNKISPDNFLSHYRIRYDGIGLQGSPAEIVENLIAINSLRSSDHDSGQLVWTVYETPSFTSAPNGANSFNPTYVTKENKAMQAYFTALLTGDPNTVHRAVNEINAIRSVKGGSIFLPLSDLEIVSHGSSLLSVNARHLASERQSVADTGFGTYAGSPLPWFDSLEAFYVINSYANS